MGMTLNSHMVRIINHPLAWFEVLMTWMVWIAHIHVRSLSLDFMYIFLLSFM